MEKDEADFWTKVKVNESWNENHIYGVAKAHFETKTKRGVLEGVLTFIGNQPQKFNYAELENDYNELSKEITRQLKELKEPGQ